MVTMITLLAIVVWLLLNYVSIMITVTYYYAYCCVDMVPSRSFHTFLVEGIAHDSNQRARFIMVFAAIMVS